MCFNIVSSLRRHGAAIAIITVVLYCQCHAQSVDVSNSDRAEQRVRLLEKSCVSNLRSLNTAQVTYWGGDDAKGFARKLSQLGPDGEGLLNQATVSGEKDGYRFRLIVAAGASDETPILHYAIIAYPSKRLSKRQRSYYTDETGIIRFTDLDHEPTSSDPPLEAPQER